MGVTSRPASQALIDDTPPTPGRKRHKVPQTAGWLPAGAERLLPLPPQEVLVGALGGAGSTAGPGPGLQLSSWAGPRRRRRSWRPGFPQLDLP